MIESLLHSVVDLKGGGHGFRSVGMLLLSVNSGITMLVTVVLLHSQSKGNELRVNVVSEIEKEEAVEAEGVYSDEGQRSSHSRVFLRLQQVRCRRLHSSAYIVEFTEL